MGIRNAMAAAVTIIATNAAFGQDGSDKAVALLQFFDAAPMVITNWGALPQPAPMPLRYEANTNIGLQLCTVKTPSNICPSGKAAVVPLSEIVEVTRIPSPTGYNIYDQPHGRGWQLKDKAGNVYREGKPPLPFVLYNGDPSKINQRDLILATTAAMATGKLKDGIGSYSAIPATEIDPESGEAHLTSVSPWMLKSMKITSQAEALAAVNEYRKFELAVQQEKEKQQAALLAQKEAKEAAEQKARQEAEGRTTAFRKTVKTGSQSHCGLVVEVKKPIAQVQTQIGLVWLQISQLYQPGDKPCNFVNGSYRD